MIETEVSVAGMIETIDALTFEDRGQFIQYDGERLAW
jgi:hypothetical protein